MAVVGMGQQLIAQGGSHSPSTPFSANIRFCGQEGCSASVPHLLQVRLRVDNMHCAHPRLAFTWELAPPAKARRTRKAAAWCPTLRDRLAQPGCSAIAPELPFSPRSHLLEAPPGPGWVIDFWARKWTIQDLSPLKVILMSYAEPNVNSLQLFPYNHIPVFFQEPWWGTSFHFSG